MNKRFRDAVTPFVSKIQPAMRVVERVTQLAVHVQKPSALGLVGLASAGLSQLANELGASKSPPSTIDLLISKGQIMRALEESGARITVHRDSSGNESVEAIVHGACLFVGFNGCLSGTVNDELSEWLRQAIDRVLPSCVEIRRKPNREYRDSHEATPFNLSRFDNDQAERIRLSTLPLIEGGRCILLDGRPGVGKTTMAQIIARDAGLGRVVMLENSIVGTMVDSNAVTGPSSGNDFRDALALLSPGVVIVDDIDKVHLSLQRLEALRASSKLVILTANNGQYDEVLDGALVRAGRVDEAFTIAPASLDRASPFDRLSDEEWNEVCQWPVAYVNEVRKRLQYRPGDIRLDDLRARLTRKARSGEVLR